MSVTVRIDIKDTIKHLDALAQSQLPFATARAITQTGLDFQKAERARFKQIFTERRADFIEKQGVKLIGGIATKAKPSITFGVDRKASFLDKFEAGGPRPTRSGSIMIPEDVKRNKRDIVSRSNRPRPLLNAKQRSGAGGVFLLTQQRGKLAPGLYQRTGRSGHGGVKLLYAREKQAQIPASLEFEKTFELIVRKNWQTNFEAALADAIRTAK